MGDEYLVEVIHAQRLIRVFIMMDEGMGQTIIVHVTSSAV